MVVTGSITPAFHIKFVTSPLLCIIAGYIPFTLLTYYITDNTFLTFEIITDGIRLIRCVAVFKNRPAFYRIQ